MSLYTLGSTGYDNKLPTYTHSVPKWCDWAMLTVGMFTNYIHFFILMFWKEQRGLCELKNFKEIIELLKQIFLLIFHADDLTFMRNMGRMKVSNIVGND